MISEKTALSARVISDAELKAAFIAALRTGGTDLLALEAARRQFPGEAKRITRGTVNGWKETDKDFLVAYMDAEADVTDMVRGAGLGLCINGTERPMISHGKPIEDPRRPGNFLVIREKSADMIKTFLRVRDKNFREAEAQDLDPRAAQEIAAAFVQVVREKLQPRLCSSCQTHVDMPRICAEELKTASAKFSGG